MGVALILGGCGFSVHAGTALVVVNVLCKWCHMIKGGGAEEVLDFIKV